MHILTDLGIAGLQKGVANLTRRLDPQRFRSSICCLETSGVFARRLAPGTEVHAMHRPARLSKRLPFRLARLLHQKRVDVVHTHNFNTLFYGGLAAAMCPAVALVHGEHGDFLYATSQRHVNWWRRGLVERAYAVHTVSEHMGRMLMKTNRIPRRKIISLVNGVELDRYAPADGSDVRAELRFGSEEVVIGALGRLVRVKNYPMLLRAAAAARPRMPRMRLLFIGDGPERPRLEALTDELGLRDATTFAGGRDDVPDLLRTVDVMAMTSLTEGMSNTVLEAMASGIPVVATAVGGNPELVRDGETGFLFAADDEPRLAELLILLADDATLRTRLGRRGREVAEDEFPIEKMMRRYALLYESAAAGRPIAEAKEAIRTAAG